MESENETVWCSPKEWFLWVGSFSESKLNSVLSDMFKNIYESVGAVSKFISFTETNYLSP